MIPIPAKASELAVRALIWGGVIVAFSAVVYSWGHRNGVRSMETPLAQEKASHAKDLSDHAQVLREYSERAAHVADLARQAQTTFVQDRDAAARKHEQELAHAAAEKDRLIAGYRAGTVQLQPWWECPSVLPAAGSAIGADFAGYRPEVDAGAAIRAASLAEGVQDGIAADAWILNLQAELTATRHACGVGP